MKKIAFFKMQAAGNDFIVIDHRRRWIFSPSRFARALCPRSTGVGGDGVLLLEGSRRADIKMRIINADGSEAEMCGNGSRCAALFAHRIFKLPRGLTIETKAGIIRAAVRESQVKVELTDPCDYEPRQMLEINGAIYHYSFINTGVPHAILEVEELGLVPVDEIGKAIRFHPRFEPAGTNVNFVQVIGAHQIAVRTYERGVGETQACGTGATASAVVSILQKKCHSPVRVGTRGGEVLRVFYEKRKASLEGKVAFIFEGKCLSL